MSFRLVQKFMTLNDPERRNGLIWRYFAKLGSFQGPLRTRSSATAKSTARPSCLVGVLYDIYRETNNRSTANQPLVRNWP